MAGCMAAFYSCTRVQLNIQQMFWGPLLHAIAVRAVRDARHRETLENSLALVSVAWLVGMSSCTLKGGRFDAQSGHIPKLLFDTQWEAIY